MSEWSPKDPSAIRPYELDWTRRIGTGRTITTAEWSATPDGLEFGESAIDGAVTSLWIANGTAGTTYRVTCRIGCDDGLVDDWTEELFVVQT